MGTETAGFCLGVPITGPILGRTMVHDDNKYVRPFEMMRGGACRGRLKLISQTDAQKHANSVRIIVTSEKH
jgi:hypothetical protein